MCAQRIYRVSEHWDVGLRDQSPLKIREHAGPGLLEKKVTCRKSSSHFTGPRPGLRLLLESKLVRTARQRD